MEALEFRANSAPIAPPDGGWSGNVYADTDLPPGLRHLVRCLLVRVQAAAPGGDAAIPIRALLRRRRGDDIDRLEARAFTRVGRGDGDAFAWIVARYDVALRLLAALVRDVDADADDLLQEARVKLWRSAPRFDPARGSVAAWVLAVAHHALLDERRGLRRRRRRRARAEPLLVAEEAGEICRDDPEDFERASAAVSALDPTLRAVLLASADCLSHAEIAASLGLPVGTVKSRVRRAQHRLRAALGAEG